MKRPQLIELKFCNASLRAEGFAGIVGAIILLGAIARCPVEIAIVRLLFE